VVTGASRPASDISFQPIWQAITQSDHMSAAAKTPWTRACASKCRSSPIRRHFRGPCSIWGRVRWRRAGLELLPGDAAHHRAVAPAAVPEHQGQPDPELARTCGQHQHELFHRQPARGITLLTGHQKHWREMATARAELTLVSRSASGPPGSPPSVSPSPSTPTWTLSPPPPADQSPPYRRGKGWTWSPRLVADLARQTHVIRQ